MERFRERLPRIGIALALLGRDLEVLFGCHARQLDMRRTESRAIEAVKAAFDEHNIEMPCRVVTLQARPPNHRTESLR